MPASGNAVWNTGDVITATKLNNMETALTASAGLSTANAFTAANTITATSGLTLNGYVVDDLIISHLMDY